MDSLQLYAEDAQQMSELIADAILKRTQPVSDDLSENEARAAYGRRWLDDKVKKGLAEYSRIGNRKIFSRHQLDCLRFAERKRAEIVRTRHLNAGGG